MTDEIKQETQVEQEEQNDIQKYLDTIASLKANSVSREEYDKVRNENTTLLQAVVNGKTIENSSTEDTSKPSIQELRNKAYGKDVDKLTDLEYVETVLDLRDAIKDETGLDPFIPVGKHYSPDVNDIQAAERTYEGLRHCVDVADGDNEVFIREITRITQDLGLPKKNNNKRRI